MTQIGDLVWSPREDFKRQSNLARYMDWLADARGRRFSSYDELWRWSVGDLGGFWQSIWDYFEVRSPTPHTAVLARDAMPGATWFAGARVNYAAHILKQWRGDGIALYVASEAGTIQSITWDEMRRRTMKLARALRAMGVVPGDRVVSYLPNIPEAAVAFLACASIGAIWSSCSPDFGAASVIDRFSQVSPKVLFATDSYRYGGKLFDRRNEVANLIAALPDLSHIVHVRGPGRTERQSSSTRVVAWETLASGPDVDETSFEFADTAFDHPLWVVYSSGTTGLPKPFLHGHGGVLLEALKFTHFHLNLKPGSCMFYFTTTGWVMWNILLSAHVAGASVVIYDGHPTYPRPDALWRIAAETRMTLFGASPTYINQQMQAGVRPNRDFDLSRLDSLLLGGSPVSPEHMDWCFENVKRDLWLTSQSGGTDVASAFVGGVPLLPVHAGEIQARCLGVDAHALDDEGQPLTDAVGELVVRKPMPSMPLRFWNDPGDKRYLASYFDVYPRLWRHGDYFKVNRRGGCFILGRSDSTLNRYGVRIGTAEIYRALDRIFDITDSLIVNLDLPGGRFFMPLFVVVKEGRVLDDALIADINRTLRDTCSPRHVPDRIFSITAVPYTLTGKKMEVPVRKILAGIAPEKAASRDAMANPQALDFFIRFAAEHRAETPNSAV